MTPKIAPAAHVLPAGKQPGAAAQVGKHVPRVSFSALLTQLAPPHASPTAGLPNRRPPSAAEPKVEKATPHAHPRRPHHETRGEDDALDPLARNLAPLAPPASPAVTPIDAVAASVASSTTPSDPHVLATELLEAAAFWGDGTRGVARLRFGARASRGLSGATVALEHDGEVLRLRVDGAGEAAEMLRERLAARGIPVAD